MRSGTSARRGGQGPGAVRRTSVEVEALGRRPAAAARVGVGHQREHQVPEADAVVPAARGRLLGGDDGLAGGRRTAEARLGSGRRRPLATNRFCTACLVTPMLRPISDQDAPERRAWSTKCPISWSATSPRWSARVDGPLSWSSALGVGAADGVDEVVEADGGRG